MSYVRPRYTPTLPPEQWARDGVSPQYHAWITSQLDALRRAIPTERVRNVVDFGATGDGFTDDTDALQRAINKVGADNGILVIPFGTYKITAALDATAFYGIVIIGDGQNAGPTFRDTAAHIVQYTSDTPILQVYGPVHLAGLSLQYNTQQSTSDTSAIGLQLNNISAGAHFERIKVYRANTSVGIPQSGFGGGSNTVFGATFNDIASYEASECHYDLRNFAGGGTHVSLNNIYVNGGGSLDFVTPGQSANYGIRGTSWLGYDFGVVSMDGLVFNQRLWDLTNCWGTAATVRAEACTTKKDSDGWINLGGSDTGFVFSYAEVRNCRALTADVTTTFLFRCNATEYRLKVGELNVTTDCTFTSATVRPLQLAGSATRSGSGVSFGKIGVGAGTFVPTIWTDSISATRVVREFDGKFVSELLKQYQSDAQVIRQSDLAAPTTGTWVAGDRTDLTSVGDLGRIVQEVCTSAGTPGAWAPSVIAGIAPVSTQGDADVTLTPKTSRQINRFAGTLTAGRTVSISTTNAWNGCQFTVVHAAAGTFDIDVGGLKTLSASSWCDAAYDGSAFRLMRYGTL